LTVLNLGINFPYGDRRGRPAELKDGRLTGVHSWQIEFVDVGGQLHAGVGSDFREPLPGIAMLTHLEIDGRNPSGDRRPDNEAVERTVYDVQIAAQDAELPVNVGQEPVTQLGLPFVAFRLDGLELFVVAELVRDYVALLRRHATQGGYGIAARGRAFESHEAIADFRKGPIVRQPVLLECDLVLLKLRDRLVQL
jgi:hypothetical protein